LEKVIEALIHLYGSIKQTKETEEKDFSNRIAISKYIIFQLFDKSLTISMDNPKVILF
jgi:hypothetical protein